MSIPSRSLDQIQRWMQTVIMHPGGTAEGVGSPESRRYVDIGPAELDCVIRPSRSLSSAERLEIYVNAYYARLMECLDEEFAVTRYALGEELFSALAFGYLQSYPSLSYTLGMLGASFPRYLAESRLHAHSPPQNSGPTWPDFVVDLATLERLLLEVYDGRGTERTGTLICFERVSTGSASSGRAWQCLCPSRYEGQRWKRSTKRSTWTRNEVRAGAPLRGPQRPSNSMWRPTSTPLSSSGSGSQCSRSTIALTEVTAPASTAARMPSLYEGQ